MTPPSWPADRPLRAWQQAAAAAVFSHPSDAFLASATPAAGKTTFGLHVAHRMLAEGHIRRVAVVAPTTHIARQWAADAARYGLDLEPNRPNSAGPEPRDRHGVAVTYQTVAAGPAVHRRRCAQAPTLLIADTELFFRQVVGRFTRRTPAPREQMSHVFLPADPTLKRLAGQVEEERRHALTLEPGGEPVAESAERVRSEPGDAFRALWSSAHGEAEMLKTTQPGETLALFAADPPPSPALAAFTRAAPAASAGAPSRPAGETAHERREHLRDERRALVSALSRLTGEPYRAIHARVNRDTGAASVTAASSAQLERGNALLEREAARRR